MSVPLLSVVIPTRGRGERLIATLDALEAQTASVPVLVVDQSEHEDARLATLARERAWLDVVRDPGRGLSRARNTGWRAARSRWIAFVDDDCHPAPDWAERLIEAIAAHPGAASVSGEVGEGAAAGDSLLVSPFHVEREAVLSGPRVAPWHMGLGVCMTLRRDVIERLGGWDERLGAGTQPFPAAEDMDFNYRFLHSGERALVTPAVRAVHEQWRRPDQLPRLFEGYMAGWCGFALKHLRGGDVRGGVWLWRLGAQDVMRMAASALRRRSRLRAAVAAGKLRGLVTGTARGLVTRW
jgi:GT2 family glycosyltransferase